MTSEQITPTQRIDKWLWHARVVKTRTLAAKLAVSGSMRVNGRRVSRASQMLRIGDMLTFMLLERVKVMRVVDFAERRGSADLARALYDELSPAPVPRGCKPAGAPAPMHDGRPTKKARRALDSINRSALK